MKLVLVMVIGMGCTSADTMYGVNPGGGGGGGSGGGHADAGTDAGDGGAMIHGIACLVTDLRTLTPCATTGAGGYTVKLGSQMATTSANGEFDIAAPLATNLVWQVSGGGIKTSLVTFNAVARIPVIATTTFGDLELGNGVLEVAGQGAIIAHVLHAGAPVQQATATTAPIAAYAPYYDGATAATWTQLGTSTHAAVWVAGIATPSASLTITSTAAPQTITGIPIGDGALTFVTVEIP